MIYQFAFLHVEISMSPKSLTVYFNNIINLNSQHESTKETMFERFMTRKVSTDLMRRNMEEDDLLHHTKLIGVRTEDWWWIHPYVCCMKASLVLVAIAMSILRTNCKIEKKTKKLNLYLALSLLLVEIFYLIRHVFFWYFLSANSTKLFTCLVVLASMVLTAGNWGLGSCVVWKVYFPGPGPRCGSCWTRGTEAPRVEAGSDIRTLFVGRPSWNEQFWLLKGNVKS